MLSAFRKFTSWAAIDPPIFFNLCSKGWSTISGPITVLLIAHILSPDQQGYFYTFSSVLALQWFLELGFSVCVVQHASHESAFLNFHPDGSCEGDPSAKSRFISLGRLALKWYSAIAVLFVFFVGMGGQLFFSAKNDPSVVWSTPWWLLCISAGLNLSILPLWSLVEGCNQLAFLYGFRLMQGIATSIALWLALLGGTDLYASAIIGFFSWLLAAGALLFLRRGLIRELLSRPSGPEISWRKEIWPFQWKLAVTWISGYFVFNLLTPVLFYFRGPVVAGQMGMTWQIVNSLSMVAASWSSTKSPQFGMLVSQKKFDDLDKLYRSSTVRAVAASIVGGAIILLGIFVLQAGFTIGSRFLPLGCVAVMLLSVATNQVVFSQAVYLRAHKKEPFMWLSVISGFVTGTAVIIMGYAWGAWGVSIGYAFTQMLVLPFSTWIWSVRRREWHSAI